ncbi:hypothetical protein, partial [Burkholderia stagnalis]|uniref:hypothetical protein n=1 Tax=Burkholderia stagnalis TaxID=1503054 RepID=UPI001582659C
FRCLGGRLGPFVALRRALGALRLGRRTAARNQAARAAPQTAAGTLVAARGALLGRIVGTRRLHGRRGRFNIVDISQNNLKMSGLAPGAGAA